MLLRSAEPDDATRLALVHHTVWRATYADLVPDSFWQTATLEERTSSWKRRLGPEAPPGRSRIIVAEVDDAVVGFGIGGPSREVGGHAPVRDVELYALYVLPEHHGTGTGQALLDVVVPPGPAQVWVAEENPRARRFYARNGFEPDGPRHADTRFGGIVEIRLVR
ncbi:MULTISPECIES: GNAT family N-acetyltransferase [Cellulosimicrobium]|uniref:GNAT family N-acetyltransferase n=1 Tax=Cellulosimicrobium TaxID=157920 RepID=UPI002097D1A4|nr:GNAT family N-acetyltransferase [Cellulosimicrobium cellulans]MCO7274010.1 GNAT family N-acetyltransferase [Cellulosimicrobium cellulans]